MLKKFFNIINNFIRRRMGTMPPSTLHISISAALVFIGFAVFKNIFDFTIAISIGGIFSLAMGIVWEIVRKSEDRVFDVVSNILGITAVIVCLNVHYLAGAIVFVIAIIGCGYAEEKRKCL